MSRARDFADLAGSADAGGITGRNLIINGNMAVSQRGDSTGVSTSDFYASDRFKTGLVSIGTWDVENSSDAPAGFSNSHKVTCTTPTGTLAASDNANVNYKFEGQDLQQLGYGSSGAKSFTISFYVKSNKTGNASLEISQTDPSSIRSVVLQYNISSANTWEYKKLTVAGDTAGQINNDNGESMQMVWWLRTGTDLTGGSHQTAWYTRVDADRNASNLDVGATANDYWQITGVQLEVGEQATPFEHRSYADTLIKCQRYYYNTYIAPQSSGSATNGLQAGTFNAGDRYNVDNFFPVEMRSQPTVVYYGGRSGSSNTADRVSIYNSDTVRSFVAEPNATIKGLRGHFDTNNTDGAIRYHFTANAEL
jgi:hypothetical protein